MLTCLNDSLITVYIDIIVVLLLFCCSFNVLVLQYYFVPNWCFPTYVTRGYIVNKCGAINQSNEVMYMGGSSAIYSNCNAMHAICTTSNWCNDKLVLLPVAFPATGVLINNNHDPGWFMFLSFLYLFFRWSSFGRR